ncbi:MAG TPA: M20/M25/M40 family metallo-hydrolase [Gemmatimonadales bacterium]|nr:M20/M25/M40 family metallo-hydrolase [Gemmatimonadales bacterium]
MRRLSLLALVFLIAPTLAAGQSADRRAAATITEADVMRRIGIIAHDSMGGRDTPSRGLDLTAEYVAAEFRRLGLRPGGDSGGYLQRYAIREMRLDQTASRVEFGGPEGTIRVEVGGDAVVMSGYGSFAGPIVLVGGPVDVTGIPEGSLQGKVVVWVADWATAPPNIFQGVQQLNRLGPAAVVMVVNNDSALARFRPMMAQPVRSIGDTRSRRGAMVAVSERAILAQLPEAASQLDAVRAATAMTLQEVPGWSGAIILRHTTVREDSAPNTVGILEGTDPALRDEYVVYSAHMDHIGTAGQGSGQCRALGADSICNGADDDASGTVGLLEIAEAFASPGARPRRSLVFVTVSGEEKGLWGSAHFAEHPPVPIDRMVANINADMIGRNWRDTIVVIGREHSDLGTTLARVSEQHPELGMTAIDDRWPQQGFYTRSDHFNFARRGVPVLFFFNGTHDDYHRAGDAPEKIDGEKLARIARLMYYLGNDVGNRTARPAWNAESHEKYVTVKSEK